jgi:hypothetical protein
MRFFFERYGTDETMGFERMKGNNGKKRIYF